VVKRTTLCCVRICIFIRRCSSIIAACCSLWTCFRWASRFDVLPPDLLCDLWHSLHTADIGCGMKYCHTGLPRFRHSPVPLPDALQWSDSNCWWLLSSICRPGLFGGFTWNEKVSNHNHQETERQVALVLHKKNTTSDDSISGFQFWYNIDMIFWKYRCIDIDIFKMNKYVNLIQAEDKTWTFSKVVCFT